MNRTDLHAHSAGKEEFRYIMPINMHTEQGRRAFNAYNRELKQRPHIKATNAARSKIYRSQPHVLEREAAQARARRAAARERRLFREEAEWAAWIRIVRALRASAAQDRAEEIAQ